MTDLRAISFSFFSIRYKARFCFPLIKSSMAILMKTRKVSVLHNTRLAYVLCSTIQSESSLLSFHNVMCGTIYIGLVCILGDRDFSDFKVSRYCIVRATVSGVFEDSQQGRFRTTSILV